MRRTLASRRVRVFPRGLGEEGKRMSTVPREPGAPRWPRLLGAVVIALLGAGLVYASVIGVLNFSRIGV